MRKIILIIFILGCIFNLVWAQEYKVKPGVVITKKNYTQYLSELKKLLPQAIFPTQINGIKNGWITMPIVKKEYPPFNIEYIEASKKNLGKFNVDSGNKVIGRQSWIAGAPFPNPKTGAELAWSTYRRAQYADDISMFADFLLFDKNSRMERKFKWYCPKKNWVGRFAYPPIPEIPGNNGEINWKCAIVILEPFDVRGFSMIRTRYEDIDKNDGVYSYIPAIRRIRRLTGADVTDPMLGSDCIYDDFEIWFQRITSKQTFNMREKEILFTRRYFEEKPMDAIKRNCFQLEWEVIPVWILEIDTNDPDYAYSKRIIYICKEGGSFTLPYSENYDQKGRMYRTNFHVHRIVPHKGRFYHDVGYNYLYRNCINGHTTAMDQYPIWRDTNNTLKVYTFKTLLKLAR
ncbi:MAG: DUF1329 domain-containing protein [Thermodesulfobacteriota bacterium]|nr:DUF1329 domain-containing protein [Thermodesulfobacteriota bacterium]